MESLFRTKIKKIQFKYFHSDLGQISHVFKSFGEALTFDLFKIRSSMAHLAVASIHHIIIS